MFLLVIVCFLPSSLGLQSFLETPTYSEVNRGSSVVLQCYILGKGGECRWEKDGNPVGIFREKYEWAGEVESGNCSLVILDASSEYDDGVWQCQVTASNFKEGDSLISEGAELVVRAAPEQVQLVGEVGGVVGEELGVECVSRGGNPPPSLSYSLAGEAVSGGAEQRNVRLLNGGWESRLALPILLTRQQQDRQLQCRADHQALTQPMETSATLDISFPPDTAVVTSNATTIQEGGSVLLTCSVSARPAAVLVWERSGEVVGRGETLVLEAVTRQEAGSYHCYGENRLGRGGEASAAVQVMFAPVVAEVENTQVELELGAEAEGLSCRSEAVPTPSYRWLRGEERREVGRGPRLLLGEVGYDHGGSYYCEAANSLGRVESQVVKVQVQGAPRVQEESRILRVREGDPLEMEVRFCANPLPVLAWEGEQGELLDTEGRSVMVEQEEGGHCYSSLLVVESARAGDGGQYRLQLQNKHGAATHLVRVEVLQSGLTREIIIAIVAGSVLTLMLLVFVLVTRCRCSSRSKSSRESKTDLESCGTSTTSQNTGDEKIDNSLEDIVFHESYESYKQPDLLPPSLKAPRTPSPQVLAPPSYNELCFPKSSNCGNMSRNLPVLDHGDRVYPGTQHYLEHINTSNYSNFVDQDSLYHWRKSVDDQPYLI